MTLFPVSWVFMVEIKVKLKGARPGNRESGWQFQTIVNQPVVLLTWPCAGTHRSCERCSSLMEHSSLEEHVRYRYKSRYRTCTNDYEIKSNTNLLLKKITNKRSDVYLMSY